jgi:FKBP-type peptidyl-prolyl cis-trans isomerase
LFVSRWIFVETGNMTIRTWTTLLAVLALALCGRVAAAEETDLTTDQQKLGYALGMDVANQLTEGLGAEFDTKAFTQGFTDRIKSPDALKLDEAAAQGIREDFFRKMQQQKMQEAQAMGEENRKAGAAFLATNEKNEGVEATASGLQYQVLRQGEGPSPSETDTVSVHYEGKLLDGTVFDSSYERGQPASFPLNQVIPGWSEGVQLMKEGAKYRFWVPSDLAYGERGAPPRIPPNSTLIFDVELLDVKDAADGE